DGSRWAIDDAGVETRACYIDDLYVFSGDGSFSNVLDDETWLEAWQGVAADQCGAPVSPHDGTTDATWSYDEDAGTLLIDGFGAYVGIPKAVNEGELPGVSVPNSVTYNVEFENTNTMRISIEAGAGVWWQYKLVRD
ncbi:MAG: glycoside hydrolase family 16 protein, partial [Luminiphilus sp.]